MAGDWIPMRTDLHDDPAVLGIAMQIGLDEDSVVGKLLRLWGWAQGQTVTGVVPNVTAEWINRKVNRTGFAEAMSAQGWLNLRTGTIEIPKFERWLGKGAKSRLLDSRRKKLVRQMSGSEPDKNRTTVQDSTGQKRKGGSKFIKPTLEEVQAYCQERQNQVSPKAWMDYYEANGWRVGKNPMRDWKAAVRTWENNGFSQANSKSSSAPSKLAEQKAAIKEKFLRGEM